MTKPLGGVKVVDLTTFLATPTTGRVLGEAGIFITNTRAKSLKKMALDWDSIHAKYPRPIMGHGLGYGKKGPEKDAAGFDGSIVGETSSTRCWAAEPCAAVVHAGTGAVCMHAHRPRPRAHPRADCLRLRQRPKAPVEAGGFAAEKVALTA